MIKKDLENMRDNTISSLEKDVIDMILDTVDEDKEIDKYINDVLQYGCKSGCVNALIYTKDCENFVKKTSS